MIKKSKIDAMELCTNFLKENKAILKKSICDAVNESKEVTNIILVDKLEVTKYNNLPALNMYVKVIEDGDVHTIFVHFLSFGTLLKLNKIDEIKDKCGKLVISEIKRKFHMKEININLDFNTSEEGDITLKSNTPYGEFSIEDMGEILQDVLLINEIKSGKISINMQGGK